jgi:hypothetical protein
VSDLLPFDSVKGKYGKNDKFTFIISLVFFQCIFNAIVSKTILLVRKTQRDSTPSIMYAFSSFTYLFAMLASNYALEFVSYPMQVRRDLWRMTLTVVESIGARKIGQTRAGDATRRTRGAKTISTIEISLRSTDCFG